MKQNLLKETLDFMAQERLLESSVIYVGTDDESCSWSEFKAMADRDYDCGFGGAEVPESLRIAFRCGAVMVRREYDGAEWWEVNRPFKMPTHTEKLKALFYE